MNCANVAQNFTDTPKTVSSEPELVRFASSLNSERCRMTGMLNELSAKLQNIVRLPTNVDNLDGAKCADSSNDFIGAVNQDLYELRRNNDKLEQALFHLTQLIG